MKDVEIKVSVETVNADSKVDQLANDLNQMGNAANKAGDDVNKLDNTINRTSSSTNKLASDQNKLARAEDQVGRSAGNAQKGLKKMSNAVGSVTPRMGKMVNLTGQANNMTLELGRLASDSAYGIRGMGNNISQVVSQFAQMTVSAKAATLATSINTGSVTANATAQILSSTSIKTLSDATVAGSLNAQRAAADKAVAEAQARHEVALSTVTDMERGIALNNRALIEERVNLSILKSTLAQSGNTTELEKSILASKIAATQKNIEGMETENLVVAKELEHLANTKLIKSGNGLAAVFKTLGTAMKGPLGIVIGIQLLISAFTHFSTKAKEATEEAEDFEAGLKNIGVAGHIANVRLNTLAKILKTTTGDTKQHKNALYELKKDGYDPATQSVDDFIKKQKELVIVEATLEAFKARITELAGKKVANDQLTIDAQESVNTIKKKGVEIDKETIKSFSRLDKFSQRDGGMGKRSANASKLSTAQEKVNTLNKEGTEIQNDLNIQTDNYRRTLEDLMKLMNINPTGQTAEGLKKDAKSFLDHVKEMQKTHSDWAREKSLGDKADHQRELQEAIDHRDDDLDIAKDLFDKKLISEKEYNDAVQAIRGEYTARTDYANQKEKERLKGEREDILSDATSFLEDKAQQERDFDTKKFEEFITKEEERKIKELEKLGATEEEKQAIRDYYAGLRFDRNESDNEKIKKSDEALEEAKQKLRDTSFTAATQLANGLGVLDEESKDLQAGVLIAENAIAVTKIIMDTGKANRELSSIALVQSAKAAAYATTGNVVQSALATNAAATAGAGIATNTVGAAGDIASLVAATVQGLGAINRSGNVIGGSPGGGEGNVAPPTFNLIEGTAEGQLSSDLGFNNEQPVRAYVVSSDITTAQSMDRNIIDNSGIG